MERIVGGDLNLTETEEYIAGAFYGLVKNTARYITPDDDLYYDINCLIKALEDIGFDVYLIK